MQGSSTTGRSWLLLCASCEVRYSVLLAVEELLLMRRVSALYGAYLLLFRQGKFRTIWRVQALELFMCTSTHVS